VKIVVVDDEPLARRRLIRMLAALAGVEVVADAEDGQRALDAIARTRPDLLLLDIHMPGLDGLALAARYAELPPVVFVTAHDEHAIRAFELGAVDYLLKPVRPARLALALDRARSRRGSARDSFAALDSAPGQALGHASPAPRVVTSERGAVRLFDARAITRFRAIDKYTAFLSAGAEHLTEEPLAALEDRLRGHGFVRVHRGELVALSAIESLESDDAGHVVRLRDGQVARVSRRLVAALRTQLGL
jgi:DNA-binding LytR/AlgR family response regulator